MHVQHAGFLLATARVIMKRLHDIFALVCKLYINHACFIIRAIPHYKINMIF
jgi:hypothetical protein